jgi:hypothetical protein
MRFGFAPTYVALWVAVICQGLLILAVLQRVEMLRRLIERGGIADRLPLGSSAPDISKPDSSREQAGLESLDGKGGLVLFLSADCAVCKVLVEAVSCLSDDLPPMIISCRGDSEGCTAFSARLGPAFRVHADPSGEAAFRYGVSVFPTAVVVGANRIIRSYSHPKNVGELKKAFLDGLANDVGLGTHPELSPTAQGPT